MNPMARWAMLYLSITRALVLLSPAVDLAVRLWVANVFFKSGLTKIANMDSTMMLFEYEYNVPLLSPFLAAYIATGVELVFPVLLAAGLGSRVVALVLFVFNGVAMVSYPDLSVAGLEQHQVWGLLILVTLLHGPGKLSADHVLAGRWQALRR